MANKASPVLDEFSVTETEVSVDYDSKIAGCIPVVAGVGLLNDDDEVENVSSATVVIMPDSCTDVDSGLRIADEVGANLYNVWEALVLNKISLEDHDFSCTIVVEETSGESASLTKRALALALHAAGGSRGALILANDFSADEEILTELGFVNHRGVYISDTRMLAQYDALMVAAGLNE